MLCVGFVYLNDPDHQKRRESHLQPQIHGSFLGREDRVLPSHSMISQGYRTDRGRWRSLTGVRIKVRSLSTFSSSPLRFNLYSLLPLSVSTNFLKNFLLFVRIKPGLFLHSLLFPLSVSTNFLKIFLLFAAGVS